jgi:small subunit ribosomal protein S4e
MILILRQRLKYALNAKEVLHITMRKLVKVDGKVRTDPRFPAGLMDVVTLEKTKENFRIMYDLKGRFTLHPLEKNEAKYKICKVLKTYVGPNKLPLATTHDGRTLRYPDPIIKAGDSIKLDLESGKVQEVYKLKVGQIVLITSGRNRGRVGILQQREQHPGSFEIIHVKDSAGNTFATRLSAAMVIGNENRPAVTLPKGKGIKLSIIEEKAQKLKRASRNK